MLPMSMPIRLALQTLRANPLRTVLSTLGIVMGAGSLASVLSLADGVEAYGRRRLESEGLQTVLVAPVTSDVIDGLRVPRGEIVRPSVEDAAALARVAGPRAGVVLSAQGVTRWLVPGDAADRAAVAQGVQILGAMPGPALAAGRALSTADLGPEARVAVVSAPVARALAGDDAGAAVGREIALDAQRVRVVGVLARREGRDEPLVQVPFAVFQALPAGGALPSLAVRAERVEATDALKAAVQRWATGRFGAGVTVAAQGQVRLQQAAQAILIFKLLMGSFTAIALLVGGIGIMNVLLASVLERTREIGVRRAVGARRRDVVLQLLAESVAIALAGSLIGLAAGVGAAFAVTAIMRAQTEALVYAAVTPGTVAASLGAATLTGLVFGVYPAVRAARLAPVDAIRTE